MKLTITLEDEEVKILEKRAKKNFLTLKEQVEDIIRRSCISASRKSKSFSSKVDDKLVGIFSREKRGRKPKKKKK
jgi:hypothetical protein